ncbi:OmpA family protein [Ruegeria faecimaris]|uniref:OmpA family protein n=1 Tax=Ruegeria faecimaris TaxID=686389 RepID=UPI002492EBB4|nr:OmpA family protein [Ruegeria faecimaris]
MNDFFGMSKTDDEGDWLSVSDLMAGLMVIFLFIAVVFIRPLQEQNNELELQKEQLEEQKRQLEEQKQSIAQIALTWQDTETKIFDKLVEEFKTDLPLWNAEIEKETLLIRFNAPEVLFSEGQSNIRAKFREILSDFFPRYVEVLSEFRPAIEEIRIEGHTSSEWSSASPEQAYYNNMALSQARTREVLSFALTLPDVAEERDWLQSLLTANGLSSSRLVLDEFGLEDPSLSRRVEFRVRTKARSEIVKILEEVQ